MMDSNFNVFVPSGKILGDLCRNQHDYQGTGRSLRHEAGKRRCVECRAIARQRERAKRKASHTPDPSLPPGKALKSLCLNGHDYQGTGRSLCYSGSGCVDCQREQRRRGQLARQLQATGASLPPGKALGALCPREHDYQGTGRSLRYVSNNHCVDCYNITAAAYRETHKKEYHLYVHKRLSLKYQAIHEYYSPEQLADHFSYFGNECAYCGNKGDLTIDHVVPISRGGANAIWNIVPACERCNKSKNDRPVLEWYRDQPFFDEDQLSFLRTSGGFGGLG